MLLCACSSEGAAGGQGGDAGQGGDRSAGGGGIDAAGPIPPELCAEGFSAVDGGCEPILPGESCPPGMIAVPGDVSCRALAPCDWSRLPSGQTVVWVDQTFAGVGDGSQAAPFTTISEAIADSLTGSVIAIEAGRYLEDLFINRTLSFYGRCPAEVEIRGSGAQFAAVVIQGADAVTIADVAISSPQLGFAASGAEGIVLERVWIHDTGHIGLDVENGAGPTQLLMRDSLVEQSGHSAAFVFGADVTIERSLLRDVIPLSVADSFGRGITAEEDPMTVTAAVVRLTQSLVERVHDAAVTAAGAELWIAGSVVRDVAPLIADPRFGYGLAIQRGLSGARSAGDFRGSLIERVHEFGVYISSSDAAAEAMVVRNIVPRQSGEFGDAFAALGWEMEGAKLFVFSSLLQQNARAGVSAFGADVVIGNTLIDCNMLDLDREVLDGVDASFDDQGHNRCGCDGSYGDCKVVSTNLQPPEPLK